MLEGAIPSSLVLNICTLTFLVYSLFFGPLLIRTLPNFIYFLVFFMSLSFAVVLFYFLKTFIHNYQSSSTLLKSLLESFKAVKDKLAYWLLFSSSLFLVGYYFLLARWWLFIVPLPSLSDDDRFFGFVISLLHDLYVYTNSLLNLKASPINSDDPISLPSPNKAPLALEESFASHESLSPIHSPLPPKSSNVSDSVLVLNESDYNNFTVSLDVTTSFEELKKEFSPLASSSGIDYSFGARGVDPSFPLAQSSGVNDDLKVYKVITGWGIEFKICSPVKPDFHMIKSVYDKGPSFYSKGPVVFYRDIFARDYLMSSMRTPTVVESVPPRPLQIFKLRP